MKVIHETWMTQFIDGYGLQAMKAMHQNLMESSFVKLIILISITTAFISLGISISRRQVSERAIKYFLCFLMICPYKSLPIGYVITETFCKAFSYSFQKGVDKIAINHEKDSLPPGYVMESFVKAATTKFEDQESRYQLMQFSSYCLPQARNKEGGKASFKDIFKFKPTYSGDQVVTITDLGFDNKSLENIDFKSTNCSALLADTRTQMLNSLPISSLSINREFTDTDSQSLEEKNKKKRTKFHALIKNYQAANAASYEASNILKNSGTWSSRYMNEDVSLRKMREAMDSSVGDLSYWFSSTWDAIANIGSGEKRSASLGAAIRDLRERIEMVPYQIADMKLLLKILCPIALLSLFLTQRLFFIWFGAMLASYMLVPILNGLRSIHNSIILSKLGLNELITNTRSIDSDNTFLDLANKVDVNLANDLLLEFTPTAFSMVATELAIINIICGSMLFAGWLAGGASSPWVSSMAQGIQSRLVNSGVGYATAKTGEKALNVASKGIAPAVSLGMDAVRKVRSTFDDQVSVGNNGLGHTKLPKSGGNNEKIV
ncbi:MAG: hypothetical protein CMP11_04715 [Zetaproteobacteria bacterium]|nr:hypothetical protein [Pseudobdellovibrionaceae bacterium]